MVELIDLQTVNINGIFAGTYDEAYGNNPDYRGELWMALQAWIANVISQRDSFASQLNECQVNLETCQTDLATCQAG